MGIIWFDHGLYWNPPDGEVDDIGEPKISIYEALRETVKIYTEYRFGDYNTAKNEELYAKEYEKLKSIKGI